MKTPLWSLLVLFAITLCHVQAGTVASSTRDKRVFSRNFAEFTVDPKIKLTPYGQPWFGTMLDLPQIVGTNGLTCLFDVPNESVYVFNRTGDVVPCLRMPLRDVCKVVLLDNRGHKVKKTGLGKRYGLRPSQAEIENWRAHWPVAGQSIFLHLVSNQDPWFLNRPTMVCQLNLFDIFDIKRPGDYTLHLQLRLIQAAEDVSGKTYYPLTLLPEVVAYLKIEPKDLPVKNP